MSRRWWSKIEQRLLPERAAERLARDVEVAAAVEMIRRGMEEDTKKRQEAAQPRKPPGPDWVPWWIIDPLYRFGVVELWREELGAPIVSFPEVVRPGANTRGLYWRPYWRGVGRA